MSRPLLFVQPFGLSEVGGGSRILRAMLTNAPIPWKSIASTWRPIPPCTIGEEVQVGGRPYLGKLERSRLLNIVLLLDKWGAANFERKFESFARRVNAIGIHSVAHCCWDTAAAFRVAQRIKIPFFISVHDDPDYLLRRHPYADEFIAATQIAWKGATERFVICEELGKEMGRRWEEAAFYRITDGVERVAESPTLRPENRLHIYFMGLFYIGYEQNLIALQKALQLLKLQRQGLDVRIILRCGSLRASAVLDPTLIEILPFGDERVVARDIEQVDLLYLPLSLSPEDAAMAQFSLSTKMITYLGSGIPILYHGPIDAAAATLLRENDAAFMVHSTDPKDIGKILEELSTNFNAAVDHVEAALGLARRMFMVEDQRRRFWDAIQTSLKQRPLPISS